MSVACPSCHAVLTLRELKPGRYHPKCARCSETFTLVVEWTVATAEPAAVSQPSVSRSGVLSKPAPRKRAPDDEDLAARMLAGGDGDDLADRMLADDATGVDAHATGDFSADLDGAPPKPKAKPLSKTVAKPPPRKADTHATGDFTAPEAPAADPEATGVSSTGASLPDGPDPHATGEFTEAEVKPKAPSRPVPKPASRPIPKPAPRKADPHVTGDFTEPAAHSPAATGVTDPSAADADHEKPTVPAAKPAKKAKREADVDAPARLGGYEVIKVLGKGGMGAVLLGRQISLDRKVALKVMHERIAQNPGFVARFTREAYAAAQLTHHNVVQIYDIGEDRGRHFFSMEFVPGQSLMDLVKEKGKLSAEAAVGYVLQAARGLRYGHNQGMVHRDIKPDNLMVNDEGIVKVADLGLVKLPSGELPEQAGAVPDAGGEGNSNLTRAGSVMGTPAYMAPEQARDSASVDQRADIYSLGCTLYVLLTGKPPFEGKTALEVISKHQTEPIIPPEVVVKRVPKALSAILLKMMAKRPEDRFQTMDDVIAALEGFLGVKQAGPFTPTEEQADQLEKYTCQFNVRSKGKLKGVLALGFFAACVLGVVGAAFAGAAALAGGVLGLMVMTPVAYFVTHGALSGGVLFPRVRALVFGMRFFDWLMWVGGGLLCLVTLYLFGLLWSWLGFAAVAALLGFLLWAITDRPQVKGQEQPIEDARGLFKKMRLQGLDEEALRQFVCKFSGSTWEPVFEALFGYEAKLAARAYRTGNTGEESRTAGAWREPIVAWLDARLEARRLAREQRHLKKIEAKALVAEGVGKAEANARADELAAALVEGAAGAQQARRQGQPADVRGMVAAARERRRPKEGYNLAGVKSRNLSFRNALNDWLGRRLRFLLGGLLFAAGLLWMYQNNLLSSENNVFKQLLAMNFEAAGKGLDKAAGKPLAVSFLPADVTKVVNSYAVPLTGFLLIVSSLLYYGWKPSVVAIPGAVVGVLGPTLGVPEAGPLSAPMVSLLIAAVLILGVARLVRK